VELVAGIDLGTGGCKVVVYDEGGNPVAESYREYPVIHPRIGWAEQDPQAWWRACVEALREVTSRVPSQEIKAVGVTSQREAFVPLDSRGNILYNSIIWLDSRAVKQEEYIRSVIDEREVIDVTGLPVDQIFTAAKLLWLKQEMPDVFSKIKVILFSKDYAIYKLSGSVATDFSMASRTMLLDIRRLEWSSKICDALNIPLDILPPLFGAWEVVGEVDRQAAELTGLRPGTPIVCGGGDRPCEALGSGTLEEGDVNLGTGTGTGVEAPLSEPRPDYRARANTCLHVVPNTWEYEIVINATGESLRWFRDNFALHEAEAAKRAGRSAYDVLTEAAARVPPGSDGLLFYPYLWGARAPYFKRNATGVFIGFTHAHGKAHFVRAVLEGVAFQYVGTLELLKELGIGVRRISMTGGETRSHLWNTIKASVVGREILVPHITDAAGLGAAMLAAVGSGVFKSFKEAVNAMVRIAHVYRPDPELHKTYRSLQRVYEEVYRHLEKIYDILGAGVPTA